jgi:Fur family peroxide stress response transcriptional regulator
MKSIPETLDKLRETGFKLTPQRVAILEVLDGNTSHPSAQAIYQAVKRRYPMISFATVYKTLKVLEKVGEIQPLTIAEDKLNFDPDTSRHHHLYCRECGRIIDIDPMNEFEPGDLDGHRVDRFQIYFYGVCADCLKPEK